ncbi:isoaspartyl peptidase/L-asparaginase [Phototrophicus methaneseepsis]|uniref:Isoaspartyl peptidase/L-asparaginase n=1 Tax=Phototrophicus methaneseepsis TaxID=2710758 RepID=A0A7S8EDM8_9CHLR|nr:isoaspartyl peptidase/L-asparaginase [Phototrophicus methaneseepsis]QPC85053.1 isoaspartyl peptidase/L-asparaginase [Phototrophicus methaneseepsis]
MKPSLIVHGGAWDWSDDKDSPILAAMQEATRIGWQLLQAGSSAMDAVEKAVNYLEDHPLFDAGTGSHLNANGIVEMDALLINGDGPDFGAVAAVTQIQHPITLARHVLENTRHNFFVGAGADELAQRLGLPIIANEMLVTEAERDFFNRSKTATGPDTVGAVAIDHTGSIAVATSTGGTPHKPAGRVGDSPMFGAGGYADSRFGGAGATGYGEQSMRLLLSKAVVDQIASGKSAQAAAEAAISQSKQLIDDLKVGVIAIDSQGRIGAAHSTAKIALSWVDEHGQIQVRVKLPPVGEAG